MLLLADQYISTMANPDAMEITIFKKKDYKEARRLYNEFKVSRNGKICIAIGGDGTFVRAAKSYSGPILPIRSEEKGSIGYYSDVSLKDIGVVIRKIKAGKYVVERLENKIELSYKGKHYFAVNEALMHNLLEEVSFKIYEVHGGKRTEVYPYTMSGDGILITGPIGSTAYNKSAGGPILLVPNVLCLTFLNADGPYRNPIVIDTSKTIEIEVVKYHATLRYDGAEIAKLKPGDTFRVRISNKELKVVRIDGMSEPLSQKLDRIIRSRMVY